MKDISQYKLKLNTFTAEVDGELDESLRTLITAECDIYEVADRDIQNGEFDRVYKAKVNGVTIVKQGDKKPILCKSKRSESQKFRMVLEKINGSDGYYERFMPKLIARAEEIVDIIENT